MVAVLFSFCFLAHSAVTVTLQDAVLVASSALVAVMVAVPAALPVTNPVSLTVAFSSLLDVQLIPLFVALSGLTVAVN